MPTFDHVKDSGEHTSFPTGARRDDRAGKGRYDLVSPFALARLARHYENGAAKYEDRNWEKGLPLSRFWDSAARHLQRYLAGDTEEDHLAAVAWNVFCLMHFEEVEPTGDKKDSIFDLPSWTKRPTIPTNEPENALANEIENSDWDPGDWV